MAHRSRLVFDWEGSLSAARQLHTVAGDLQGLADRRAPLAEAALADWLGPFADDFITRFNDEQTNVNTLVPALRAEADGWALEWKRAMDQENQNRYANAVDRVHARRSTWDSVWGGLTGHDDLPSMPSPANIPTAPSYWPSRGFANYSSY